MKRNYRTPVARKVNYSYDEKIVAQSYPISDLVKAFDWKERCTWGDRTCNAIYNKPQAKGFNNCGYQGD